MSAAYKGVGGQMGWGGWGGGGLRLPLDTMGPVVVPNEPAMVSKPHHKAQQDV